MIDPYRETTRDWPEHLRHKFTSDHLIHFEETGSTNDDLLDALKNGKAKAFTVLSADYQSRGRGRRGDRWEATPGTNLLFSLALPLDPDRTTWGRLPHFAAYALGRSVESLLGSNSRVEAKWPNDLLIEGRKLAGILVETVFTPEPYAVVGIGCNVNLRITDLPPELQKTATSLYGQLDCESSRWFLLGLIIREFLEGYPDKTINFTAVHEWISTRDRLRGRRVRIDSAAGTFEGISSGIAAEGQLLLKLDDGSTREIVSADRILFC